MADDDNEMAKRARLAVLDALEPILPKGSRVEARVLLPGHVDNIEMTIGVAPTKSPPLGLRDGDPIGFVCGRCGWQGPRPRDGEGLDQWRDRMAAMKQPSDLDAFRAMLERANVPFEMKDGGVLIDCGPEAVRVWFNADGSLVRGEGAFGVSY